MKAIKITIVILSAALLAIGIGTTASAFHSGGVAECGGCHSMHNAGAGSSFLLVGGSGTSAACLTCHEHAGDTGPSGYHISTADADMPDGVAPLQRTPGGDFGWLKKTYTFTVRGETITEEGATHGHNIVATDLGYDADPVNQVAPGGTFSSTNLACNSCHDPHGKFRRTSDTDVVTTGAPIVSSGSYANAPAASGTAAVGVYRLLAGLGYTTKNVTAAAFPGVPAAVAPGSQTYNRTEASTETRVAYGIKSTTGHSTWGNWCGACHTNMHQSSGNLVHPVDVPLGTTDSSIYKNYVKSGEMLASGSNGYTSLVPFSEAGTYADLAAKAVITNAYNAGPGPDGVAQVNCMTCHRAHASGWEYALRWNMEGEFMTYNSLYPGTDTTPTVPQFSRGRKGAETQAAYYDRPVTVFASYQRVLCNKCHAKD